MQVPKTAGMRHVAIFVTKLTECVAFYTELMGMEIEWQPDPDNVYLTSGIDNLALHQAKCDEFPLEQRLDHIGFILDRIEDVDLWHTFLLENNIKMKTAPRTHRDGARSFYCYDPSGNTVQLIYHPPLSAF